MPETTITAPLPTNQTLQGPRIIYENARLVVEYDYEYDDVENGDPVGWAEVIFTDVICYRFSDGVCSDADDVLSSTEIRRQDQSALLTSVLTRWNDILGCDEWQQQQGGSDRFKHFTIYFDDVGTINVIASACEVSRTYSRIGVLRRVGHWGGWRARRAPFPPGGGDEVV